ncbi:MAG TPA: EamA family transporter [Pyrinomonadaceae bacterium]|jgi:drug/metabolite transporter (DMT)-like permease|nr:EamA family transporter [Pyrinomonadaceae bacterium]
MRTELLETTGGDGAACPVPAPEALGALALDTARGGEHLPGAGERGSMLLPVVAWLVLTLIWGSTWLFIKIGLEDLPPVSFAGIRFIIAAAILFVIVALRSAPLPRARRDWLLIGATGLLSFTLNYGLLFWGEQHVSSGLAAVLQTTIPAFGLVIAHFHLPQERLTLLKLSGVALGVVGVGIIFSNQLDFGGAKALWGSAAIVVGAFGAAYANVLVKARGGNLDPAMLAGGQMFFGLIPLVGFGLWTEGNPLRFHWTTMAVVSLLYLAVVGSTVAFLLYYWLVKHMDVTKTMLIALVTPLIAVTLGMLVLDERLTWRTLAGGACIMAGVGVIVARRMKQEAKT